mmetsp:Transcript_46051/g.144105  ORF Transcript_46051/g.144105 Transcript_46051/m.144105 type:complete len:261 (-) Transcript_46051:584-1366(-)
MVHVRVEARIGVSVGDVNDLSLTKYVPRDALVDGQPVPLHVLRDDALELVMQGVGEVDGYTLRLEKVVAVLYDPLRGLIRVHVSGEGREHAQQSPSESAIPHRISEERDVLEVNGREVRDLTRQIFIVGGERNDLRAVGACIPRRRNLVDGHHHAVHVPSDHDRHREHTPRGEVRELVHAGEEAIIRLRILHINDVAARRRGAHDPARKRHREAPLQVLGDGEAKPREAPVDDENTDALGLQQVVRLAHERHEPALRVRT